MVEVGECGMITQGTDQSDGYDLDTILKKSFYNVSYFNIFIPVSWILYSVTFLFFILIYISDFEPEHYKTHFLHFW